MTAHTPGPWHIGLYENTEDGSHKIQIETADRRSLAPAYVWHPTLKEKCLTNAHLIAAAPEMLETLRNLVEGLENISPENCDSDNWASPHVEGECEKCIVTGYITMGRAAIAKAEGKV